MKKSGLFLVGLLAVGSLLMVCAASAATQPPASPTGGHWMGRPDQQPGRNDNRGRGIFGTVSNISGDTLSVQSRGFGPNSVTTTYSVDATNATVLKDNTTSTLSSVALNDTLMVRGTINGTNIVATEIRDGLPAGRGQGRFGQNGNAARPPVAQIQGNGQPIIGGAVTGINGSTLTVTNQGNVTYTVDATNATIVKNNTTSSLASISLNDDVLIQGTVNGANVVATSVIDHAMPTKPNSAPAEATNGRGAAKGFFGSIFGGIGGFFQHLFKFF